MATESKKTAKSGKTAAKTPRTKKTVKEEEVEATPVMDVNVQGGSFIPAVGRRKTSIARIRLVKNGKGLITVNGREMEKYFTTYELRNTVSSPLKTIGQENVLDVSAMVEGGGLRGQAEAIRLGITRAVVELNPAFRKTLKKLGYLTRDPRAKERKKPGLRKARRAPQWSKR